MTRVPCSFGLQKRPQFVGIEFQDTSALFPNFHRSTSCKHAANPRIQKCNNPTVIQPQQAVASRSDKGRIKNTESENRIPGQSAKLIQIINFDAK